MAAIDGPSWSDIADWYDELLVGGSGPHETAVQCLRQLLPDLGGATVLDVACGQGLATRAVASSGPDSVTGVDASATNDSEGTPAVVVTGYFRERFWRSLNPHGVRRAGNYHRTLSTYLNGLVRAGFVIDTVDEPMASDLLAKQQPLYNEVPIFFAGRATRR